MVSTDMVNGRNLSNEGVANSDKIGYNGTAFSL